MNSQKLWRWLSKNFDTQGVVIFLLRNYTYGMLSIKKMFTTQEIGLFTTPSKLRDDVS